MEKDKKKNKCKTCGQERPCLCEHDNYAQPAPTGKYKGGKGTSHHTPKSNQQAEKWSKYSKGKRAKGAKKKK